MEITLRKFERELEKYTRNRMRELRGEAPSPWEDDPFIEAYTGRRIREMRLEHQTAQRKIDLDNRKLGSYTVSTMGDHDGTS